MIVYLVCYAASLLLALGGRGVPKGPLAGDGAVQQPLQNPGAPALPEHQRQV